MSKSRPNRLIQDRSKRKFLKTAWGGIIVFGSGFIGVPLSACSSGGGEESGDSGFLPDGDNPDLLADSNADGLWIPSDTKELAAADSKELYGADGSRLPPDLTEEDLAKFPEMTDQEAEDFMAEIEDAAADIKQEVDAGGKPIVPPGQHVVEVWPVMANNSSPRTVQEWQFYIQGQILHDKLYTWEQFNNLEVIDITTNFHCVTGWTFLNIPWKAVRYSHLLELAGATDKGKYVVTDCELGYTTNMTIADALNPEAFIAVGAYGGMLEGKYGGPARGVIPFKYGYKSGKWVKGIRVLEFDEPGYWETKGYSNTADPWTQDRYD